MTQAQRAKEIGVSRQAFHDWKRKGAPVDDDYNLAVWILNQERITAKVRAWCKKVISKKTPRANSIVATGDELKDLEGVLEFYMGKLNAALADEALDSIKFWNEHVLKTSESIRKSQAHAAKLGIDNGTTLARSEVERILRAVFYAGNACVNSNMTMIAQRISGLDEAEDVYNELKPAIVGARLFSGFDKVANVQGAPAIPDWVLECVRLEAGQYLGNSESLWTK